MNNEISFRKPEKKHGYPVYKLVESSPPLDLNSLYYYLIFCSHYKDTSVIAEINGQLSGFISGYIKPGNPDTLFIWQVAVNENARGKKLGRNMINEIVSRKELKRIKYLETTVTPSNKASRAMFYGFAKFKNASVKEEVFFGKEHFGELGHEEEVLFRIGPFNQEE